jgi:hypothetical protein
LQEALLFGDALEARGMKGQWIGKYDGSNQGGIVVNVDEVYGYFGGTAYIHPNDANMPKSQVVFRTKDKSPKFSFQTLGMWALAPGSFDPVSWDAIKDRYPLGTTMSSEAEVEGDWSDTTLTLRWKTDIGSLAIARSMRQRPERRRR